MSYTVHHAIVVTSPIDDLLYRAHAFASGMFSIVTPVTEAAMNGHRSFMVPPDGSKEGWSESDDGNERRRLFVNWLNAQRYEDGSTSLKWVEVEYGGDDGDGDQCSIVNHSERK